MPRAAVSAGFFGKIPAAGDFVTWNLPRAFTDRWDRWMSRDLIEHPSRGPLDPRAWRFTVPAGIFCDAPAAGVWRMSEDRAGRRYPLVIARLAILPDPGVAWFDEAERTVGAAVDAKRPLPSLVDGVKRLPTEVSAGSLDGILFWIDDWEVQELRFTDIFDLARNGLISMRGRRAVQAIQHP